jgi:glycosyltransferase involved in cell wall biosynthesis
MIVENGNYPGDPRVATEARTLRDWGYAVTVIGPNDKTVSNQRTIDGVKVYQFPHIHFFSGILGYTLEYGSAALAIATLTAYVCITQGFDIVHVANPPDFIVPLVSIYKLFGKRIIFDQHDLTPELYAARFSHTNAILLWMQTLLERLSYRLADHSIVTNESYRAIALGRGGCLRSEVTIVRNGPDLDRLPAQEVDEELRKRAPHIIVFAGIVGYQDGLDCLCRALNHLRSSLGRKDFLCVVLGDGDALRDIQVLARQLDLDSNIWFAGWISDRDLYWRYLATADICVSPEPSNSYNDRSTFVKIMEYMAVGKPIVAFDLPESRLSAGRAALFVTPNNEPEFAAKLNQLMDRPDLRRSMGEFARRRIESDLAWRYSIPQLASVYSRVSQSENEATPSNRAAGA